MIRFPEATSGFYEFGMTRPQMILSVRRQARLKEGVKICVRTDVAWDNFFMGCDASGAQVHVRKVEHSPRGSFLTRDSPHDTYDECKGDQWRQRAERCFGDTGRCWNRIHMSVEFQRGRRRADPQFCRFLERDARHGGFCFNRCVIP